MSIDIKIPLFSLPVELEHNEILQCVFNVSGKKEKKLQRSNISLIRFLIEQWGARAAWLKVSPAPRLCTASHSPESRACQARPTSERSIQDPQHFHRLRLGIKTQSTF